MIKWICFILWSIWKMLRTPYSKFYSINQYSTFKYVLYHLAVFVSVHNNTFNRLAILSKAADTGLLLMMLVAPTYIVDFFFANRVVVESRSAAPPRQHLCSPPLIHVPLCRLGMGLRGPYTIETWCRCCCCNCWWWQTIVIYAHLQFQRVSNWRTIRQTELYLAMGLCFGCELENGTAKKKTNWVFSGIEPGNIELVYRVFRWRLIHLFLLWYSSETSWLQSILFTTCFDQSVQK